ncbi:S8 family peptidase [Streptomyces armeniacus]|uniref:S8 family peptidase n=1 Tax=Streptomyces armeniacus TaxID=83291 RepID=UPI001FE2571E|nr:S8 family peptidase [Streptomyces armeniacus]
MQHAKRTKKKSRIAVASAAAFVLIGGTAVGAGALESADTPGPGGSGVGEIRGADAPGTIDGEYIVVMKKTGEEAADSARLKSRTSVRELAGSLLDDADARGAAVQRTYATALKGFTVTADRDEARRLAADPAVAYVEQNRVERGNGTQNDPTWGLDRVDQRDLPLSDSYSYDSEAANVNAYIVDSGIRITHEEFGSRAKYGVDFVDDDAKADDCHGHGTHVAGTVGGATYGVAKSAKLVAVRVLDCENRGTTADVIAGYDWVAKNAVKPAVANVSIGGAATDAKDAAVTGMVEAGVTVAVSAGNSNTDSCQQSPARAPAVLTVAATSDTDARWASSNYGKCVDLFAPGHQVVSAGRASDTASATMTGTSMAAPHVTGAAALYLGAHPTASPSTVTKAMLDASSKSKVTSPGADSPNRLLYSRF